MQGGANARWASLAWWGPLAVVAAANLAFGAWRPPREAVPWWLGLFAASIGLVALAGRGLIRARLSRAAQDRVALVGAALLGASCLAAPPSLSDDVERYAWDGHVTLSGRDPFAHRPVELVGVDPYLDGAALSRLNSPRYYSVYPPLAQLAFALGAGVERATGLAATRALQIVFLLGALLSVGLVLRLARRRGVGIGWALAFAWSPLVGWELVHGAHTEALMLPPLLLALAAAWDGRAGRAGLWLGLAAGAKLTALLFAPALAVYLWRRTGPRAALVGLAPAVLALGFVPFASESLLAHVGESLALFTGDFSFNAPVYYAARDALGYVEGLTPPVDARLVPALQALGGAWILGSALAARAPARLPRVLAFGLVGYLLVSRVLHPWYVLPALALGALGRSRALVVLSWTVPLSYLRYTLDREAPWVLGLELAPFAALAVADWSRGALAARGPRAASSPPE